VSESLHPFIRGFSKAYALSGSSTILVDAGPSQGGISRARRRLASARIDPKSVALIILTHGHGDHVGLLAALRSLTGAPLMAHRNAAAALAEGRDEAVVGRTPALRRLLRILPPAAVGSRTTVDVDRIIEDEADLSPYGVEARLIPTPGHTDGSVSLLTADGRALIGDMIMEFLPGRPRLSLIASNPRALADSLRQLLDRGARTFYPSHGRPLDRTVVERLVGAASRRTASG